MANEDEDSEFIGRGSKARSTDTDNFFRPLTHGFETVAGLMRAQTAGLLRDRLNEQRATAEVLRQAQARVVKNISDKATREAFEIGSKIDQQEIGAIATTVRLAQFDRNSQFIQAGLGGVGLVSDFSRNGGGLGGLGGGAMNPLASPMVLGAGILTAGILASRNASDDPVRALQVTVPVPGGVFTGNA